MRFVLVMYSFAILGKIRHSGEASKLPAEQKNDKEKVQSIFLYIGTLFQSGLCFRIVNALNPTRGWNPLSKFAAMKLTLYLRTMIAFTREGISAVRPGP